MVLLVLTKVVDGLTPRPVLRFRDGHLDAAAVVLEGHLVVVVAISVVYEVKVAPAVMMAVVQIIQTREAGLLLKSMGAAMAAAAAQEVGGQRRRRRV